MCRSMYRSTVSATVVPCCPAPMSCSMFITCALLEQINDDDDDDLRQTVLIPGIRCLACTYRLRAPRRWRHRAPLTQQVQVQVLTLTGASSGRGKKLTLATSNSHIVHTMILASMILILMATYRSCNLPNLTESYRNWPNLTETDRIWQKMTISDPIWPNLTQCDRIWQNLS